MKKHTVSAVRSRSRGVSLIEVLISMVIGIVVVGAVLVSYISSGQTGKRQAAYSEMNENAQIGLTIIRQDLLLAGYARGTEIVTGGGGVKSFGRTFSTKPIFGCATGFSAPNSVAVTDPACGTGSSPAIEVIYEADLENSVPNGGFPSDCLGNSLQYVVQTATAGGNSINYYQTRNRYYLATGTSGRSELHCASAAKTSANAAIAGQPLVDNVEAMQILYGEAASGGSRQIVRYVDAGAVTDWQNIISVRTCLLMRSAEKVLSAEDTTAGAAAYLDCASASQTSGDGYVRRAYFLTTTLRNKMTF